MPTEDEHTAPSEWCPHPERWHAPDGWATEDEVAELIGALVRATQPDLAVETGTYLGAGAVAVGQALARNGHGRLDTIEVDPARAEHAEKACWGLPVKVIFGDSADYRPAEPIGFLFLDGDPHTRADDLDRLWPYLEDGALVAIHDTAPHHGSPVAAMTAGRAAVHLRTPRGLLLLQKGPSS